MTKHQLKHASESISVELLISAETWRLGLGCSGSRHFFRMRIRRKLLRGWFNDMKINRFLRTFVPIAVIAIFLPVSVFAETFTAYLTSAQEVPTNASTARGFARIFLNESAGTITYTITFSGLSSNQAASHVHASAGGTIGANSPVIINTGNTGATSGTLTGSSPITATQIAQLRAHSAYINVHSANFSGGEIRGQLGILRPVDNDGDGRTDLSVLRFPTVAPPGVAQITYWNANSTEGVSSFPLGDANTDFPVPGDFDGDGKGDYTVYRAGANPGDQSKFYTLRSIDNTVLVTGYGINGDQNICRDYDGDGRTDFAIYRRGATAAAQATWWIKPSSGSGGDTVVPFGLTGNGTTSFDSPIPGDYDGDGKFDIAVYRFGSAPANNFIILNSSNGAVSFQPFGNFNSDYIVPADYDGDGKYDLAIARTGAVATSPLVWWIRQSSSGATRTQTFGITSDLPTQGDYDGDARTDLSIYRAGAPVGSQSSYWVLNSLSNTSQTLPWGVGGDFSVNTYDSR